MSTPKRDDLLLARIEPAISGQEYGPRFPDIELVLLATRHRGASLFPISAGPVFVPVARPLVHGVEKRDTPQHDEFQNIAWSEPYRTEEDAQKKLR